MAVEDDIKEIRKDVASINGRLDTIEKNHLAHIWDALLDISVKIGELTREDKNIDKKVEKMGLMDTAKEHVGEVTLVTTGLGLVTTAAAMNNLVMLAAGFGLIGLGIVWYAIKRWAPKEG
jgi:hypothetical protein